jgi:general secretion pathway protein G
MPAARDKMTGVIPKRSRAIAEQKEPYMKRRDNIRRAFTLIELLLVLVILAVLAAVVVPRLTGRVESARRGGTISTISNIKTALGVFETDIGRFPSTEESLAFLQTNLTNDAKWAGPYLEKWPPLDGWGNEFDYKYPGLEYPDSYDLTSPGPDGVLGTDDDIHKDTVY